MQAVRILGIVASSRRLGNTELLVTEAAQVAADVAGGAATVRLLRLTDLKLSYCTGCMLCAAGDGGPCPLQDDMDFLLSELEAADALVFGTPAYTLLPPGPVKLIADRLIMALARRKGQAPRPAVTIGVAGLPRWSELMLPFLNGLVMAFGFRLVDSVLAYAAGPGEVLLSRDQVDHVRAAGTALGRALAGEAVRPHFGAGHCPVCGADFFRITGSDIECPLCLTRGTLVDGLPRFEAEPAHRWQPAALDHHFHDWIQGTLPAYLERRAEIRRLQKPYRATAPEWVKPPVPES